MLYSLLLVAAAFHIGCGHSVVHMQQDQLVADNKVNKPLPGFSFATYYNDHMVLQQAPRQAVVWGYFPDIGAKIIVKVNELTKSYSTETKPGPLPGIGFWTVTLDPIPNGGPYTISAYAEDGANIAIRDVLFGDVWVCSGQSNMQFSTDQIFNATEELNGASKYRNIRLFTVAMKASVVPLPDLLDIVEFWSLPNATTVGKSPFNYFSAVCWLFGKLLYEQLQYPIGLIDTTWGGTPVEAWSSPDALKRCGAENSPQQRNMAMEEQYNPVQGPSDNSQLWNAMVNPLLKLTIYGAIWYQGEADSDGGVKMNRYNCTFPAMINDWRAKFSAASAQTSPNFPFGFVQLAPWKPDMTQIVGFPDIRWHQTADYGYVPNPAMTNVFMSVAMDLPDFTSDYGNIHPRDKQDVAQRLFLSGMQVAYNKGSTAVQGPLPVSVAQEGNYVTVKYDSTAGPLRLASGEGFEFCCSWNGGDKCASQNAWWLPTPIQTSTTSTISLDGTVCGDGQYITALRYAWRESPCIFKKCAIYSQSTDLPGPPFITVKPDSAGRLFTYEIDWSEPQRIPN